MTRVLMTVFALLLFAGTSFAGPIIERIKERRTQKHGQSYGCSAGQYAVACGTCTTNCQAGCVACSQGQCFPQTAVTLTGPQCVNGVCTPPPKQMPGVRK